VADDRREHPRVIHPFPAQWHAATVPARVRIGDLSVGGCFVESLVLPKVGELTSVSVEVGDRTFMFSGHVVSLDRVGFSMKFDPLPAEDAGDLTRRLADIKQ
jgi:hypothetical protein